MPVILISQTTYKSLISGIKVCVCVCMTLLTVSAVLEVNELIQHFDTSVRMH